MHTGRGLKILIVVWILAISGSAVIGGQGPSPAGWFFAVSGDSRDCGDLIMPKIAKSIEMNSAKAPVQFFVHLGDLRRMYDIDCDIALRWNPDFDCRARRQPLGPEAMNNYLHMAWDDYIKHQIEPFGSIPYFAGIGNHELYAHRTREDFRKKFQPWLTQEPLHRQRMIDSRRGLYTNEGDTYYHFIERGLDFIFLDNADGNSFTPAEIDWLSQVLSFDAQDESVKTIVVGMHAALPFSKSSGHAMDATCQGRCSGEQVYDMLYQAQNLAGPAATQKHVYVLASHAHLFMENIFDTPDHAGQVLPGWIVGTAGAEQYTQDIRYGYLQVEVRPDGTLNPVFKEVTADSPPQATGPGAEALTKFCFTENKHPMSNANVAPKMECACGAAK